MAKAVLDYRERRPPSPLDSWVECVWTLNADASVAGHPVPPDGCVDLLYDRQRGLSIAGAMSVQQRFDLPPGASAGVRFHPGMAASFLHGDVAELNDSVVSLDDIHPRFSRDLAERMRNANSLASAMQMLLAALRPAVRTPNPVQRAIQAIVAVKGRAAIDCCACQANLSDRQFRRRCREESGFTPKLLARILRFRNARDLAWKSPASMNWPGIAAEAGYFDQAHLIRDFRQFTGGLPTSVFSNTMQPSKANFKK
jgi:methylphosphotriester-DNA--protein-cysteine methyltransferase